MEFPTKIVLLALLVNGFGGLFKGFGIGYVSIYMTYNTMNANCSALHSEEACNSVKHADCKWASARNGSGSLCLFGDYDQGLCEEIEGGEHACRLASQCYYDQDSKLCKHVAGWSATQSGIFAGAMTVGAMGGSFAAGPILDTIGRRRTLTVIGLIGFLSTALIMVGRAVDNFALLVFCRAFSGVGIGGTNVACPMYVKETVPERFQGPLGVTFSVFLTFGILWASLMGLVMAPTDFSRDLNMEARFQAMNVWLLLITAVLFVVGCCIPESPHFVAVRRKAGSLHAVEDSTATEVTAETKGLIAKSGSIQDHEKSQAQKPSAVASLRPMLLPLTVATVLSAAQQLTGMMAIMNYAPSITKAAGLKPLVGNFVVMLWNGTTTTASIFIAKRFSSRTMYLTACMIASLSCLLTAIPVYPGVASEDTRHILAALGIVIFVAAFAIGMGPPFFLLAMEIFPSSFRSKGCSYTNACQYACALITTVFFPIAVEWFSGGKSGNQDKGLSIVFLLFACTGLSAWVFLWRTMHPAQDDAGGNDRN